MAAIRMKAAMMLAVALAACLSIPVSSASAPSPPGDLVLVNQGGPEDSDSTSHSGELSNYQAIQWQAATPGRQPITRYRIYRNGIAYATVSAPTQFKGYISGKTLTVTSVSSGTVIPGARWSAPGVATGTLISGPQLSGKPGGHGDYPVNIPQKVGSFWHPVTFTAWIYIDTAATGSNDPDFNAPIRSYSYAVAAVDAAGQEGSRTAQYAAYAYQNGYSNWDDANYDYGAVVANYAGTAGNPRGGAHDFEADFTAGGGLNLVAGKPQAPLYDLSLGAFRYLTVDINPGPNVGYTLFLSLVSRLPPGDVYGWTGGVQNVFAYGPPPVANSWATYRIPLSALGMGECTFTGSIDGTTLTVTSVDSGPAIVDAGGFITGPGVPAGSYIVAYGQKGAIGKFTLAGPGVTAATRVGSETMTYQRMTFYKSTIQPDKLPVRGTSDARGNDLILYINNLGWTAN